VTLKAWNTTTKEDKGFGVISRLQNLFESKCWESDIIEDEIIGEWKIGGFVFDGEQFGDRGLEDQWKN